MLRETARVFHHHLFLELDAEHARRGQIPAAPAMSSSLLSAIDDAKCRSMTLE